MSPDYIMVFMAMILELRPPYLRIKDDVLKYVQVTGGGLHQYHLPEAMADQWTQWLTAKTRR